MIFHISGPCLEAGHLRAELIRKVVRIEQCQESALRIGVRDDESAAEQVAASGPHTDSPAVVHHDLFNGRLGANLSPEPAGGVG